MENNDWKDLIKFYESFENHEGWKELQWMRDFVIHLIANRNLRNIYHFTSHETLCLTKYRTYSEWKDKPLVTVDVNWGADEQYRYKFSLVNRRDENDMMREFIESVFCSFDKSLEIFDEMVRKLEVMSE